MKHVVSISLGSSTRDHRVRKELLGEEYLIERMGVNGNYDKFIELLREYDGKADAIGIGGISLYLPVKDRTYVIKNAIPFMKAVSKTHFGDGTALRDTLEPNAIFKLVEKNVLNLQNKKVMIACAVDRYKLTEALVQSGCSIVCADMIFALGIPFTVKSLKGLDRLARTLAPVVTKLPFDMLYPTGQREENVEDPVKYARYYKDADIIAGDFNYIKRYMPDDLEGKSVITNTVTAENIQELKKRGVSLLVTTTPELNGRSFGTNVMEAVVAAALNKPPRSITREEYIDMADKLSFDPRVVILGRT